MQFEISLAYCRILLWDMTRMSTRTCGRCTTPALFKISASVVFFCGTSTSTVRWNLFSSDSAHAAAAASGSVPFAKTFFNS